MASSVARSSATRSSAWSVGYLDPCDLVEPRFPDWCCSDWPASVGRGSPFEPRSAGVGRPVGWAVQRALHSHPPRWPQKGRQNSGVSSCDSFPLDVSFWLLGAPFPRRKAWKAELRLTLWCRQEGSCLHRSSLWATWEVWPSRQSPRPVRCCLWRSWRKFWGVCPQFRLLTAAWRAQEEGSGLPAADRANVSRVGGGNVKIAVFGGDWGGVECGQFPGTVMNIDETTGLFERPKARAAAR